MSNTKKSTTQSKQSKQSKIGSTGQQDAPRQADTGTGTGTVVRTVRVLRALANINGDASLGELAERLGLPPSTVHRLLDLLASDGMVERDEATRLYRPGMEFFRMSASVYNRMPVRSLALPFLREAADENEESAYLALRDLRAGNMVFVASADSPHLLSYRVTFNEPQSLVTGASGLAMLAWMSDEDRDRVLTAESQAGVIKDAKARSALLKELTQIRDQGYAQTYGRRIKGAVGIFAPVFDAHSNVTGSLGYTVPELRFKDSILPKLSEAAIRHAGALANALGYPGADPESRSLSRNNKGTKSGRR